MPDPREGRPFRVEFTSGAHVYINALTAEDAAAACGSLWNRLLNGNVVKRVVPADRTLDYLARHVVIVTSPNLEV